MKKSPAILNPELENLLLENIRQAIEAQPVHVIIFQDYNKGVITKSVIEKVIEMATLKNIPVAVDPKKKNFETYKGVQLFKPNLKELREGLKTDFYPTDKTPCRKHCCLAARSRQA
jgi:D-glycero-beta-D-manno-heptose-7-phosphate kinase